MFRPRTVVGLLLVVVPVVLALLGPVLTGPPAPRTRPFVADEGHPLGTDFVGRDVWQQVLLGGRSVVAVALLATIVVYLVGVPVGLLAATTRRRWLDELLMRPMDLLLAVPSLLLLLLLAAVLPRGAGTLVGIVALIGLPEVTRVVRAAALPLAHGPAMEAMLSQGESWWRRSVGYLGRTVRRVLAADAGVRFIGALYLAATASFLGVGVAPDASDWAVMVDRNRGGIFLAPWAVVLPALLIVSLAVGVNLLADQALAGRALAGKRLTAPVPPAQTPSHPALPAQPSPAQSPPCPAPWSTSYCQCRALRPGLIPPHCQYEVDRGSRAGDVPDQGVGS